MANKPIRTIASQITETELLPGLKAFIMPTRVERIVTIKASLIGGDYFPPQKNKMAADTMVEMLDQGTEKYNKQELHDLIDSKGISIDFSISRFQLNIFAHCLSEDVALTVELISQMLTKPTFPAEELDVIRLRMIGETKERATDTRTRAMEALTRKLYSADNPNYHLSAEEEISYLETVNREDLLRFHKLLGMGNMFVVAVGDIKPKQFSEDLAKNFKGWRTTKLAIPTVPPTKAPVMSTVNVPIADKTSADVVIGTTIPIGDKHPDFYPMMLATNILGGGFTARLAQEVRDKKGLTYGAYSYMTGTGNNTPGYWFSWATFAPELLKKGLDALMFETKKFITKGVSAKELAQKKKTITGGYKVGLSTTQGLATIILSNIEHGRPKEFVDQYPGVIEKITLAEVNGCIKKYLNVKNLVTAIAGSI